MSASVTRELHNILFFHVWEKTNENMYRSLDFSVFSSRLQVLREWVEVVTLLPVPTHFCSSFEVVLLLQCLMMVWVAPIELHCQPTHHGECVIDVWLGKKSNVCIIVLAVAVMWPILCRRFCHGLWMLLVFAAASFSYLVDIPSLPAVFKGMNA